MQRTARIRGGRRVWEGVAGGQGGERGCEEGREREDPSPRGVRLGAGCCRLQRWVPGAGRWQEVPSPPRTLPAAWPPQGSSPAALCSLPSILSPLPWASPSTPTGRPGRSQKAFGRRQQRTRPTPLSLRASRSPQRPARNCGSLAPLFSKALPGARGQALPWAPSESTAWHPQIVVTTQERPAGRGPSPEQASRRGSPGHGIPKAR